MEKVSHYLTVSDHAYSPPGSGSSRLVLSGRTGKLLFVPDEVGRDLRARVVPARNEALLDELRAAEIVVPAEQDELEALVARNARATESPSAATFTLLPSSYCNMGCDYCGQTHQRGGLGEEGERATIARIIAAMERPGLRSIRVNWFGAEPMTGYKSILRISDAVVPAAEARSVEYASYMATNGTLLSIERLRALHTRARLRALDVTLDGPAATHDRHRPLLNGRASFRVITGILRAALDEPDLAGLAWRLRTNIDNRNAEFVGAYLDEMKRLGFDHPNVSFDLQAVYSWSNDVSAIELEKELFADLKVSWMVQMLRLGLRFPVVPAKPRPVTCVAMRTTDEVISSSGSLFACTEHPLVPRHEREDVLGRLDAPPAQQRRRGSLALFTEHVREKRFPCHQCAIFGICGGACPKHWYEGHPACPDHKYNMQARLDIHAHLHGMRIL
ncbi:radical SAM/SPASM domain-containing protein [Polyangium spumosum]|uniref:SPASM domain-containing protein n=1 Tax=Polyangium spumosum TaxID=889282 RepID=A0A6N7Q4R5_9BACT|nr:radical SAM protein [Polyangium spumosum]MRG97264.1 SPASM domain-containing protein [Polyangium spumosum]